MEYTDYEPTDAAIDSTPRPRAAQDTAARRRRTKDEGRRTDDDRPPTIPARRYVPFGVGALMLILLMIGRSSWQLTRKPVALQITPIPSQTMVRTSVLASAPPVQPPATPVRTIAAYAAPDGLLLGQIEADRAIVPVAHYGSDWIAYQDGAGLVWLRAADVPGLALVGPDLAPLPPVGRGLTVDTAVWVPVATPAAPTAAPIVDAPLRIRAEDDCNSEHGRCTPPCTAEHGRCSAGDK